MKYSTKRVLVICGLIPAAGTLLIFFYKWILCAQFAINQDLLAIEVIWGMTSVLSNITGFLFLMLAPDRLFKPWSIKPLAGMLLLLIDFPIYYGVAKWDRMIKNRIYVRICNDTSNPDLHYKISTKGYTRNLSIDLLSSGDCTIDYYLPEGRVSYHSDNYDSVDYVADTLYVETVDSTYQIQLEKISAGECVGLSLRDGMKMFKVTDGHEKELSNDEDPYNIPK